MPLLGVFLLLFVLASRGFFSQADAAPRTAHVKRYKKPRKVCNKKRYLCEPTWPK